MGGIDVEHLTTGIPDLDLVMGGGLPLGSLAILSGGPGTGKTILAQQICFANATPERKAIYYTTLSEPHAKLIRHLESFEFFDPAGIGKTVEFIHLASLMAEDGYRAVAAEIARKCFEEHPAIVVVDSSKALHPFSADGDMREAVYGLASRVAHTDAVLLFVGEYTSDEVATDPEFAVADAIMFVANESQGPMDRRWLRVLKMRGSDYLSGTHSFRIDESGIRVFPRLESLPRPARAALSGDRISTGAGGLDQMLGGGLPAASATLVAGPSGAGKTVLALQFVGEGLARGERCLYVSFQESADQLRSKARAFGWDLGPAIESGQLEVLRVEPVELGLDAVGAQMRAATLDGPVSRVVVDGITELRHAEGGTDRFPDYLWSVVDLFRRTGAATLLTSETTVFFGPTFELAGGLSFVVDNVILLRYAELDSEIRRALSVVKMRDSDHTKSLVEFEIGARGFTVKAKFAGLTGVLTGTPVHAEERFREFFGR